MKTAFIAVFVLLVAASAQQPTPDRLTAIARLDSLHLIPCGPVIGTFTQDARVEVADTVGGWARLRVEGWVPVEVARSRMKAESSLTVGADDSAVVSPVRPQCAAITAKGERCSRKAQTGSKYCWQHQRKD